MKKSVIFFIVIALVGGIFYSAFRYSQKTEPAAETKTSGPISVAVQTPKQSVSLTQNIQYPAITAGDQEITLTAQTSGTITKLNIDLGTKVGQNMQIATIDNIGSFSETGDSLKSNSINALELAKESAEESYKAARDVYRKDDTYANKKTKEIAKINLEIAETNLSGALDSHFVISPISGVVTERSVSQGDSVTIGQTIAKISKTGLTKVQFFIDKENLLNFKPGMTVNINEDGNEISGIVTRISPEADPATRRFLVEAKPQNKKPLIIGSVIYVTLQIIKTPNVDGNLILPLSAITVGQNENHIFIVENGKAKKIEVKIANVVGEAAEINVQLPEDAQIIVDGSKLVKDGDSISITSSQ